MSLMNIIRKYSSYIISIIFGIMLFYNALEKSLDYLNFNYNYKLIIDDNRRGIELPAIWMCTDSKVLFDKHQVLNYFDMNSDYSEFENKTILCF